MTQKTVQNIVDYLLKALTRHRNAHIETHGRLPVPPLFVGLQGPQGIGKTTLTRSLQTALDDLPLSPSSASSGNDLIRKPRLAILSLDDFYLPYEQLVALASKPVSVSPLPGCTSDEPHLSPNKLLKGRGQPGTHDIPLLEDTLVKLSHINTPLVVSPSLSPASPSDEPRFSSVQLPIFDKSLHSGMGDRVPPSEAGSASTLSGPVDIVVLEGWCMGFYPIPSESLRGRWDQVLNNKEDIRPEADLERRVLSSLGVTLPELDEINARVAQYAAHIYPFFTTFIQVSRLPSSRDFPAALNFDTPYMSSSHRIAPARILRYIAGG